MEVIAVTEARLTRSIDDKIIAGVCGGLAAYLDIDTVLVRLAFLVLLFASGIGLPIYLIMWVIMPAEGSEGRPNAEVIQKNIEEMGNTVSARMNRIGRPGTVGVLLVLFGFYFLFSEFGWLNWLSGEIFWPLVIVGLGVYLLLRRGR
jgi:phage shock protein C